MWDKTAVPERTTERQLSPKFAIPELRYRRGSLRLLSVVEAPPPIARIRVTRSGPRGGVSFQRGALFALLSNRIYLGEIVHKGTAYAGDHEAIIDRELWDEVQALITRNRVEHRLGTRTANPSLLTGIITDGRGRRMSPSHTKKGTRRYRYYVTHISECIEEGPPAWRMPALDIEAAVVRRLQLWLNDRRAIRDMLPGGSAAEELEAVIAMAARAASRLEDPSHRRRIVAQAVGAVQVQVDHLRITLDVQGLGAVLRRQLDPAIAAPVLTASGTKVRQGKATKLVFPGEDGCATEADPALIRLLREAQEAHAVMVQSPTLSVSQMARQRRVCRHRLMRVIKLSWLAPDIVTAIVEGRHPASLTAKRLLDADLPIDWAGQKQRLGFV